MSVAKLRNIIWRTLFVACLSIATMAPAAGAAADGQVVAGLQSSAFKILDANGTELLGHAHYQVTHNDGKVVLIGKNSYRDGEYDREHAVVTLRDGAAPALVSFEHSFFNADGSLKLSGRADPGTGDAVCVSRESGRMVTLEKHIAFPPNTYAGATSILPIAHALSLSDKQTSFHIFDCAPGPSLVSVVAQREDKKNWHFYPGKLTLVDVTANLGLLGKMIEGLLPHRLVWFDPSAGWRYVGGKMQHYFAQGPQVLLVRESPPDSQAPLGEPAR
jgi:hypothetical protein